MAKRRAFVLPFDLEDQPLPPTEAPEPAEVLAVQLGFADVGWMDIEILAGREAFDFRTSYVFDPYPEILAWLEAATRGESRRVEVDGEGVGTHLILGGTNHDEEVRFTVIEEHSGEGRPLTRKMKRIVDGHSETYELLCDITLPRRRFVAAFYKGLGEGWESPTPESFWERWYNAPLDQWHESYDEPFEKLRYGMRSDVIEAYLRR